METRGKSYRINNLSLSNFGIFRHPYSLFVFCLTVLFTRVGISHAWNTSNIIAWHLTYLKMKMSMKNTLIKVTQINKISKNQLHNAANGCQIFNLCGKHWNLKPKTLLVAINKLFVFSAILSWSKAKHDFYQFSQCLAELEQKFKFLWASCIAKWFHKTELQESYF